jgi:hypothetical protein
VVKGGCGLCLAFARIMFIRRKDPTQLGDVISYARSHEYHSSGTALGSPPAIAHRHGTPGAPQWAVWGRYLMMRSA